MPEGKFLHQQTVNNKLHCGDFYTSSYCRCKLNTDCIGFNFSSKLCAMILQDGSEGAGGIFTGGALFIKGGLLNLHIYTNVFLEPAKSLKETLKIQKSW